MVNVALIGLGEIARDAHLPALLTTSDVRVVAVADPDLARRVSVAPLLPEGVTFLESLDQVLDRGDVDAVVLATPPWVTPQLTVQAARRDVFVLAEKPVATSVEATRVYEALSPDERARVQVGLTYRHDPALSALREVISTGELGGPLLVRAHIYDETRTEDLAHSELIERTLEHGSPVVHEGSHVMDWLRFLLGSQANVRDAWAVRSRESLATPNIVGARIDYADDNVALVEFGWLADVLPRCELSVLGDRGYALLDGASFTLTITTRAGTHTINPPGDRVLRCFALQLQRFVELVSGRRSQAEPSLDDGLYALALSERVAEDALTSAITEGGHP